jgi:hypothetical protein
VLWPFVTYPLSPLQKQKQKLNEIATASSESHNGKAETMSRISKDSNTDSMSEEELVRLRDKLKSDASKSDEMLERMAKEIEKRNEKVIALKVFFFFFFFFNQFNSNHITVHLILYH